MKFDLKWVTKARYELILKLDGAIWLRIIFNPPDPKKGHGRTNKSKRIKKSCLNYPSYCIFSRGAQVKSQKSNFQSEMSGHLSLIVPACEVHKPCMKNVYEHTFPPKMDSSQSCLPWPTETTADMNLCSCYKKASHKRHGIVRHLTKNSAPAVEMWCMSMRKKVSGTQPPDCNKQSIRKLNPLADTL